MAQLSRIVTIGDITLSPNGNGKEDRLQLQATAKTYRALEAGEQTAKAGKP
ncbi:Pilus assembly protein, PilO [compost metagenome]